MATFMGLDLGTLLDTMGSGMRERIVPQTQVPQGLATLAFGDGPDPWQGLSYGGGQGGGIWGRVSYGNQRSVWDGLSYGSQRTSAWDRLSFGPGPGLASVWDRVQNTQARKQQEAIAAATGQPVGAVLGGQGATFDPAVWGKPDVTAIDRQLGARGVRNAAISGSLLTQLAAKYGVPVVAVLAVLNQESGYGTDPGALHDAFNYMGLTGEGTAGSVTIVGSDGKPRTFARFNSAQEGLEAAIRNMAGPQYHNLPLGQYLALYLTGDVNGATDGAGNYTADYVQNAIAIASNLGVNIDGSTVVVRPRQSGTAPYQGGAGGMASIWGGQQASITQGYGVVTPGIDQGIYGYGQAYGLPQGHTGDDIGLSRGTRLYMPTGLTGVVETAGGTAYFRDEDYGDQGTPGKGELRIRLSNGDILILGHTSQIAVQVGQQLRGGDFVGLSGSASGDHLHLEVRVRQPDGSYRLVDPAAYFGGGGGSGGRYTP